MKKRSSLRAVIQIILTMLGLLTVTPGAVSEDNIVVPSDAPYEWRSPKVGKFNIWGKYEFEISKGDQDAYRVCFHWNQSESVCRVIGELPDDTFHVLYDANLHPTLESVTIGLFFDRHLPIIIGFDCHKITLTEEEEIEVHKKCMESED